jgi:hypothetical protein
MQQGHTLDIVVPDTFIVYNNDGHNAIKRAEELFT